MNDFDDFDDDDIDLDVSLSVPFVITGLIMMVLGFSLPIFLGNERLKILCLIMFCLSFFVITKKQKIDSDLL